MTEILNDGLLDIMVGRSRYEKRWKHKEIQWSALLAKLETTHRTTETYAEYIKVKPAKQDAIKDIGGFVGGLMSGGRRKNGSVIHRQILTLDLDFCPETQQLIDKIDLEADYACCIYSTHKHSAEKPRLRMLIPLDRPVNIDEYEAIGRKIASLYDIDWFDPTTFQPTRLMYWPSTSKNGEYVFKTWDTPWLKADGVLEMYHNWQDATMWPISSQEAEKVRSVRRTQADPTEKVGLIGAFCRSYDVATVIERYLSDVYEVGTVENRYTLKTGSTSNGLVVYDDKFVYSHHSTDVCSGKLCNVWDLVRLHKFSELDENYDERESNTGQKRPSLVAMMELAAGDENVKATIGREKLEEAQNVFGDEDLGKEIIEDEDGGDWFRKLEVDGKGNYLNTINNVVVILENDPLLKGRFQFNDIDKTEVVIGKLPWKEEPGARQLTERDLSALRHYFEMIYKITTASKIEDAVTIVALKNHFNPVRDWILSKDWDGLKRAETLFVEYLGASDNIYTRTVTRKSLLACVWRIFEPGCKFDNMVVLIGEQGIGKSTILKRLGQQWHSDTLNNINSKESYEQLQGAWIVEFSELSSIRNAEVEQIKHFLSKSEDRFRVAYGRAVEVFKRMCVFFGTTNNERFLKDETGNRRFWPVTTDMSKATEDVFEYFTREEAQQVWAEVYTWYIMGEIPVLDLKSEFEAKKVRANHMEGDERVGMVEEFLNIKLPDGWEKMHVYEKRAYLEGDELTQIGKVLRQHISGIELYCELFKGQIRDYNSRVGKEMHSLLTKIPGWAYRSNKRRNKYYGRQKVFERVT